MQTMETSVATVQGVYHASESSVLSHTAMDAVLLACNFIRLIALILCRYVMGGLGNLEDLERESLRCSVERRFR
ncbi:hypothetical protein RIF29_16263 [Crotalaria pallida]|uniref:Uncharacterized protein n=1 Tax=Crotalaria pallida TaxID=3830 RepID=A0AAN9IEA6_CROPI